VRKDISDNMETRNHNEANSPRRDEIGSPQSDCDMSRLRLLCCRFFVCRFLLLLFGCFMVHLPPCVSIEQDCFNFRSLEICFYRAEEKFIFIGFGAVTYNVIRVLEANADTRALRKAGATFKF
jgi:hypothetical protein